MTTKRNLGVFFFITFAVTLLICLKESQIKSGIYFMAAIEDMPHQQEAIEDANATLWKAEQQRRRLAVREACRGYDREDLLKHLLNNREVLKQLLVDDKHQAIYCYVPKVSCSVWKKIWAVMTGRFKLGENGELPPNNPHSITQQMSLASQKLTEEELRYKLSTYTKFIAVRHPFERLLSAFRNKFQSNSTNSRIFQRLYASRIIRNHRPKAPKRSEEPKKSENPRLTGEGLKFSEFVSYLLQRKRSMSLGKVNEHWRPYEDLCHPCALSYDVIAKYESLEEDSERFLRRVGAPRDLHFPRYAPTETSSVLASYLSSLSHEQLVGLGTAFQRDFQLFQYDSEGFPKT